MLRNKIVEKFLNLLLEGVHRFKFYLNAHCEFVSLIVIHILQIIEKKLTAFNVIWLAQRSEKSLQSYNKLYWVYKLIPFPTNYVRLLLLFEMQILDFLKEIISLILKFIKKIENTQPYDFFRTPLNFSHYKYYSFLISLYVYFFFIALNLFIGRQISHRLMCRKYSDLIYWIEEVLYFNPKGRLITAYEVEAKEKLAQKMLDAFNKSSLSHESLAYLYRMTMKKQLAKTKEIYWELFGDPKIYTKRPFAAYADLRNRVAQAKHELSLTEKILDKLIELAEFLGFNPEVHPSVTVTLLYSAILIYCYLIFSFIKNKWDKKKKEKEKK